MPLALDQGVGCVAWSPLGFARLTGKIRRGQRLPETSRLRHEDATAGGPSPSPTSTCSGSWTPWTPWPRRRARPCRRWRSTGCCGGRASRTSIIGARNEEQLRQNLGAVGWELTPEQVARLDAASEATPAYPTWHQRLYAERNPPAV